VTSGLETGQGRCASATTAHNVTAPTAMFRHLHTMFEANVVNYLVGAPMTNEANLPHAP